LNPSPEKNDSLSREKSLHGINSIMVAKINVRKFNLFYGEFQALKDITLDIEANYITAIILLDGINILETEVVGLRKRVGMVFQRPNPFPKSVFDNVAYGPRAHGISSTHQLAAIVEASLRDAALWDEVKDGLDKSALDLGAGQQQRLCIARTIAVKPDVVLMDEPASALDPIATLHIEELIQKLKENYTIIIVTHNMQQAARASDFTAFFHMAEGGAGYLVEYNRTIDLFTSPKQKLTEDYISGRFG
jgi:phosphate transport system ATP-binding protein